MTRLAIRVSDFVRANPGLTLEEIARGVHARTAAVRQVLVGKGFSSSLRLSYPSDTAKVYRVAKATRDGRGRVARPSQNERVAQVLADGHFHTAAELHRRCGTMRLNSRIAELRKLRGWLIVCERVPDAGTGPESYRYRLVGTSEGVEAPACRVSAPSDASLSAAGAGASVSQLRMEAA